MRRRVRLTERDLNNIIRESVKRSLYTEGLGDTLRGGLQGLRTGANRMSVQKDDTAELEHWATCAQQVLAKKDPQAAFSFLERFVDTFAALKRTQAIDYGKNSVGGGWWS